MSLRAEKSAFGSVWLLILITCLFFLWGMANNLNDILIPQFKKVFVLTDLESGFVQSAFYLGYFFLSLPAAFIMGKFGYKTAIIIGLLLYALGAFLFLPAAELQAYQYFLGALFVIASGLAFLETAANPLITLIGPEKSAAFRLNLAQSFNPLGSLSGILIGQYFILSHTTHDEAAFNAMSEAAKQAFYTAELNAVKIPYLVIGCVVMLWALLILLARFPDLKTGGAAEEKVSMIKGLGELFKRPIYLLGVMAQFFYVGAQVGIWSYMIRYGGVELSLTEKDAATYVLYTLILFWVGRVVGTGLMRFIAPKLVLLVFCVCNIALMGVAITMGGLEGLYALVASSFFMSIMFPTIFATSVSGLGRLTQLGSSLLVMSIIGGAVLTALMGAVSDAASIKIAMSVPLVCFVMIAFYALSAPKDVSLDNAPSH